MAEYDQGNLFRKIINGDIPSYKIFENDEVLCILDAFPCTPGHSLLLPKAETTDASDMDEETAKCLRFLPKLCNAVKQATGADAVNIVSNVGAAAGQVVFHTHFHVIPRISGDGILKHPESAKEMIKSDDASAMVTEISKFL